MPLSVSGLLLSRETDIDQRALEYINLFIKYFNIELKRAKLTSHTNTLMFYHIFISNKVNFAHM
jgi:hypothetical protein